MRPSSMQMSRTSPSTPLAGSWTVPPVMRSRRGALMPSSRCPARSTAREQRASVSAAVRAPRSGGRSGSGTSSMRYAVPRS